MNWRAAFVLFSLDSILFSSIALAMILGVLTLQCIKRADKLSVHSKYQHKQLVRTLIVQVRDFSFFYKLHTSCIAIPMWSKNDCLLEL